MSETPEAWAQRLKEKEDYRSLAAVFNSQDYSKEFALFRKQKLAKRILEDAGAEAVDSIMGELSTEGVGRADLADILVSIGDPKAVPMLKKMLDRGCFDAFSTKYFVESFVSKHPELQVAVEEVACSLCHKVRPVKELRRVLPSYLFCKDTCWDKRRRLIGSTWRVALNCPFYSEGMCKVGEGANTCSLGLGTYDTKCYVYRLGMTRRF